MLSLLPHTYFNAETLHPEPGQAVTQKTAIDYVTGSSYMFLSNLSRRLDDYMCCIFLDAFGHQKISRAIVISILSQCSDIRFVSS